jgi:hypothetical protein
MVLSLILTDTTGSQKSKMAAAKPKLRICRFIDTTATQLTPNNFRLSFTAMLQLAQLDVMAATNGRDAELYRLL